jgi:hypothetical protein
MAFRYHLISLSLKPLVECSDGPTSCSYQPFISISHFVSNYLSIYLSIYLSLSLLPSASLMPSAVIGPYLSTNISNSWAITTPSFRKSTLSKRDLSVLEREEERERERDSSGKRGDRRDRKSRGSTENRVSPKLSHQKESADGSFSKKKYAILYIYTYTYIFSHFQIDTKRETEREGESEFMSV